MKKDLGVHPYLFPMPVIMISTYGENDKVDVMNMAWGGICDNNMVALNITESHKTAKNIKERKAFTLSIADVEHLEESDFFGTASGNTMEDKFERTNMHATKSTRVDAPIIEEYPVTLECKCKSWSDETGILVGEIICMHADESVLTDGKVDLDKLQPIMFDMASNTYRTIGPVVGKAFHDGLELKK